MYGFLLALLVLDGIFLAVIILLQAGKGGGLAAMGGGAAATDGVMGGRQATTVLTRATWSSGTAFMVLALVLSILSGRQQGQASSVIRPDLPQSTAPAPVLPGLEDVAGEAGGEASTEPAGEGGGDEAGGSDEG